MSLNPDDDCIHCDRGTCGGRCQADWIVRKEPTWEPMCQCGGPKNHCVGPR